MRINLSGPDITNAEIGAVSEVLRSGRLSLGPKVPEFEVTTPIGPVPHPPLGTVHAASPGGKPSRSLFRVLGERDGSFLAEIDIATGRPHQIRIHAAAAGHPLVGDPLYAAGGRPSASSKALPGDPGYLLHSELLRLRHPRGGEEIELRCAPPPGLRERSGRNQYN